MAKLKNINFMSKERFDSLSEVSDDELYAVRSQVVVESYTDEDGNWYRVYSDGWIEQGGNQTLGSANSWVGISLLKEMANTRYTIRANISGEAKTFYDVKVGNASKNTRTTAYFIASNANTGVTWEVKGQGA